MLTNAIIQKQHDYEGREGRNWLRLRRIFAPFVRFVVIFRCTLNVLKSSETSGEATVGQAAVCAFASYGSGV